MEARTLAQNYMLIDAVVKNIPPLVDRFDPWTEKWGQEAQTLGWHPSWLDVSAGIYDISTETPQDTNRRLNAAKMLRRSIGPEHDEWLRTGTDMANPQAIFRRMHLKFRGTSALAQSGKLLSRLNDSTMASTGNSVVAYGALLMEICRRLREMNEPPDTQRVIGLYLLGLSKPFDQIRYDLQSRMSSGAATRPNSLADATAMVEKWAASMPDRNLLHVKEGNRRSGQETTIHTLLGDTKSTSRPSGATTYGQSSTRSTAGKNDCRQWVKTGRCERHGQGTCNYTHSSRHRGVNKPPPARDNRPAPKTEDHSDKYCSLCKVKGHSERWSQCPTRLKQRAGKDGRKPTTSAGHRSAPHHRAHLASTTEGIPDDADAALDPSDPSEEPSDQ